MKRYLIIATLLAILLLTVGLAGCTKRYYRDGVGSWNEGQRSPGDYTTIYPGQISRAEKKDVSEQGGAVGGPYVNVENDDLAQTRKDRFHEEELSNANRTIFELQEKIKSLEEEIERLRKK